MTTSYTPNVICYAKFCLDESNFFLETPAQEKISAIAVSKVFEGKDFIKDLIGWLGEAKLVYTGKSDDQTPGFVREPVGRLTAELRLLDLTPAYNSTHPTWKTVIESGPCTLELVLHMEPSTATNKPEKSKVPVYLGLDIETTGLDPMNDEILEIAMVSLNSDFEVLDSLAVVFPHNTDFGPTVGSLMDNYVRDMHAASGLLDAVTNLEAELLLGGEELRRDAIRSRVTLIDYFIKRNFGTWGMNVANNAKPHLVGSTVAFDRSFMEHHYPELASQFGHRNIDVSVMYELAKSLGYGEFADKYVAQAVRKHRAMDDIKRSVDLLRFYRSIFETGLLCTYKEKAV